MGVTTILIIEQQISDTILNDAGRPTKPSEKPDKYRKIVTEDNQQLLTETEIDYITED